uniref:Uncharacterized protein n=1 Tax=Anguilla anguilla TaxID=7936 RepID=A0A0E9WGL6_ANGAN
MYNGEKNNKNTKPKRYGTESIGYIKLKIHNTSTWSPAKCLAFSKKSIHSSVPIY